MAKVFVSYAHADGEWVWMRLKPCLEAGGAEVLIDRERFRAGQAVFDQMDATQDRADVQLLVVTKAYLASKACSHEMARAVALDPVFAKGVVIPVRRDDASWPRKLTRPNPLYVDLRDDTGAAAWDLLLKGCRAALTPGAPDWLRARDEVVRWLTRKESVNLVVNGDNVPWRALIEHIQGCSVARTLVPDLKVVDLESGVTASRPGLLSEILTAFGVTASLPDKPRDAVEFERLLRGLPFSRLALAHFDLVAHRPEEYGLDLFSTLRHAIAPWPSEHAAHAAEKRLALLIQSRRPLAALLPADNPLSKLDVKTVELRARP